MKKSKRKALVYKEENILLSKSAIIENYPELKEVLHKYNAIYINDLKNSKYFDDKLRNLLLYVFKDIMDEAVKEWKGNEKVDLAEGKEINCSLCGRKNEYIHYIKNIHNDVILNVGSDCIDKFPKMNTGLAQGTTAKQHKNKVKREYQRLRKLEFFNEKFPNTKEMLSDWYKEYNSLPIILPVDLHNKINDLHKEANDIYINYAEGKISDEKLDRFETLIKERENLKLLSDDFIDKNRNKEFICTRKIYNWIIEEYDKDSNKIINNIRRNNCILSENILKLIYEEEFFKKHLFRFKSMIDSNRLFLIELSENDVIFEFIGSTKTIKYTLYIPKKIFVKLYGGLLINTDSNISEEEILKHSKLVFNENNYVIFENEINKILLESSYRIELNYFNMKYGLEVIDDTEKMFSEGLHTETFFNTHKNLILLNEVEATTAIVDSIRKLKKWRPLSDKKKYNIEDIRINNRSF